LQKLFEIIQLGKTPKLFSLLALRSSILVSVTQVWLPWQIKESVSNALTHV